MKTFQSIASALLATGSTVVALLTLTSLIPAELGFAGLATLGITALALFDYSRPVASLTVPAALLRPLQPSASASPLITPVRRAA